MKSEISATAAPSSPAATTCPTVRSTAALPAVIEVCSRSVATWPRQIANSAAAASRTAHPTVATTSNRRGFGAGSGGGGCQATGCTGPGVVVTRTSWQVPTKENEPPRSELHPTEGARRRLRGGYRNRHLGDAPVGGD